VSSPTADPEATRSRSGSRVAVRIVQQEFRRTVNAIATHAPTLLMRADETAAVVARETNTGKAPLMIDHKSGVALARR
jgi:hypothetical protein